VKQGLPLPEPLPNRALQRLERRRQFFLVRQAAATYGARMVTTVLAEASASAQGAA
jgi:hypothetical protein